jgi:hypothetical protein
MSENRPYVAGGRAAKLAAGDLVNGPVSARSILVARRAAPRFDRDFRPQAYLDCA